MHMKPHCRLGMQVSTESVVNLCDFGQGKLIIDFSPTSFSNDLAATRYRAPELVKSLEYTKAADIYSAGVFVFDVLFNSVRSLPEDEPALVPRKLWEICARCMVQEPPNRPTAIEIVFELEHIKDDDFEKENFDLVDLRKLVESWINVSHEAKGFIESSMSVAEDSFMKSFTSSKRDIF